VVTDVRSRTTGCLRRARTRLAGLGVDAVDPFGEFGAKFADAGMQSEPTLVVDRIGSCVPVDEIVDVVSAPVKPSDVLAVGERSADGFAGSE